MWTLRGYVVERLLGTGGTGEVWRARVAATGEPVALKRLPLPDAARARAEAAKLAALDHPHLVRLHALVPGREMSVLVLDLADGGSLADLLAARGRLTPAEVITAVAPIAAALAYLHTAGVVHGDVTPANILFTPGGIPLLADLGVARITGDDADAESTPAYVDPCVADGCVPGAVSDVFMLGAVALHALTGAPPWPGPPEEALAAAHAERIGDVAGRLEAAGVAPEMAAVVLRALEMEPSLRGTAAEFALELRHSGEPVAVELHAGRTAPVSASASASLSVSGPVSVPTRTWSWEAGSVPAGRPLGSAAAPGGAAAVPARDRVPSFPRVPVAPAAVDRRPWWRSRSGRSARSEREPHGSEARESATADPSGDSGAREVWTGPRHAAVLPAPPPTRSLRPRPRPAIPRPRRAWHPPALRRPRTTPAEGRAPGGGPLSLRRSGEVTPDARAPGGGAARRARGRSIVFSTVLVVAGVVAGAVLVVVLRGGAASGPSPVAQRDPAPRTSSGARVVPSAPRTLPSRSTQRPVAVPPATWAGRLAALDGMRERAFAARRPELLRQVYAPGPLLVADTRLLLRLVPAGCGLVGVRTSYRDVRARPRGDGVDITATASLPASQLRCSGRPTARAAPTGPVTLTLRLLRAGSGWRIVTQAPA